MGQQALTDLLYVAAFFLGGLAFAVGPFVISFLLAPRNTRNTINKTEQIIECGMEPIGAAWIRFGIVYYLYALMFLAFAVDILFLFPVAMAYNDGYVIRDFVELVIFVGVLSLAVIYAWKKGVFKWGRKVYSRQ
ncbi:MAG: NADH-quinone oxidoreductase subunit A [Desulfurivibrionaceae bacterium]|nr:NADH-quinone oxidoreductase subunit A [Desulfobulbales bacterium]MDT8334515.1 NADH-quinone oxidoreductase subunit A [Desulfurivibrionaceae bacterium]